MIVQRLTASAGRGPLNSNATSTAKRQSHMEQHWEVPEADVEVYNHRFKLAEFSDKERDTGLTEVSEAAVESR